MKLELYDNINSYTDDVLDILARHEIQNSLLISNCLRGKDGMSTEDWFMGVIKDAGGIPQLIALMTPPHNVVIYERDNIPNNEAVALLAKEMVNLDVKVPGVLAEKSLALRFSDQYSSLTGTVIKDGKKMRIYRLDEVNEVPMSSGSLRRAEERDLFFLPYWNAGFLLDCREAHSVDIPEAVERVKRSIGNNALYIWEDEVPVSQAAMGRKTLNGAVVNAVYTPPHFRGKGYATSCVASLSRKLLDDGYEFCSLFTDLANPVSNSIYMKIGYKPVCDYDEYRFEEVPA
ncbi:GNAT family N-acetyltransferase [Pseudoclostridium thermosuccinogenes]|jgi:predicted GNAT family acetyltransferase|uniref:GNAT family N-acetyltransferase n=1 Tax=Clostridium thermosuccinogenes TaxID=84032 RepID=UPI000CCC4A47|nr:GNAT family N-acetyltransferase [Pseudoclostridium thermosuccinogenes]PNT90570.1 hypothetical protein CDQ83_18150 [Pseudoclostridium thermosuccinogenes]